MLNFSLPHNMLRQLSLPASTTGKSTVQYTHSKHGAEVAEISKQLLHRGLLGIDRKVLQHVVIQRLHIAVHYHQLVILLPCNLAEAVRVCGQGHQHIYHILSVN